MNQPTISILTICNLENFEPTKLLLKRINEQTYKNLSEWIIIDSSRNLEESNCLRVLIHEIIELNSNPNLKILFESDNNFEDREKLGKLKNMANKKAQSDIIIWMEPDNFYFNNRVEHVVNKLSNSSNMIAGCTNTYIHNLITKKTYKTTWQSSNDTSYGFIAKGSLAYTKSYAEEHLFDETTNENDDKLFTNNYNISLEFLLPECTMIKFIYPENLSQNERYLLTIANFAKIDIISKLEDKLLDYLIPNNSYNEYVNIFIGLTSDYLPYDLVYMTGGHGIEWEPSDSKLGGSEQAVVNLSENWTRMGKKVAVYGNFKNNQTYNGVDYFNWIDYPLEKRVKNLIVWRTPGILYFMELNSNADNLMVDFHDNFSYTLAKLDFNKLKPFLDKVNKFYFKSQYHKMCFDDFIKDKLPEDKYYIIINGVRIEPFTNNKILNWDQPLVRNPYRFCYCSSYDRGLETILDKIWPEIYKKEPRAELHIYYGMEHLYDEAFRTRLKLLMSQPGVMDHGRQSMDMVIREKHLATFHLYMTDTVAEIDCISIRESLVAGCIPVLSKFGVFAERHGIQYDWNPQNEELCKLIGQDIANKMNDFDFVQQARQQLQKSSTIVGWDWVANKWLETIK
jgi:hypothetical protein